ncbi:MAG: amino-acid racemase [Actinomycetota bacterium]|nr:amino-acid racemase [Actinomycetota bacterium]
MSWESSAEYYRLINTMVREQAGGFHSAELVLVSIDFATFEPLLAAGRWDAVAQRLIQAAQDAVRAGAEAILICTNTGHKVADEVAGAIDVPVVNVVDVVAEAVLARGFDTVGLLGTRFTMTESFFPDRLSRYGIRTIVPSPDEQVDVNRVIFDELVLGVFRDDSRSALASLTQALAARGAQGVVLGCTELELLLRAHDTEVPLFPTARLHAAAAVQVALAP